MIDKIIGHFKKKVEMNIQSQMKTKKFQKYIKKFGKVFKKKIKTINGGEEIEYGKDF